MPAYHRHSFKVFDMNRFLLKNDTTENVSARVTVSPSDELGNLGHDAATVIEGDRLTTCLAPTAVALPDPVNHKSECFELDDRGLYAVEVNGIVQPYAFKPSDLLDAFSGSHVTGIQFKLCDDNPGISCAGAIVGAVTGGIWGEPIVSLDGVPMGDLFSDEVFAKLDIRREGELRTYFLNRTTNFLRVEIRHASLSEGDSGWGLNENPTQEYDIEAGSISFCLAPAEVRPPISCDGASPTFEAKTSLEQNTIEVSVDGGPWLSMYDVTDISASMMPGNPGADIRFSLLDEDPRLVRVRTSRDIGLYVNLDRGFDQINTNTAYTLYDRNGLMIDPFDPKNQDHSGREFDYTDTTDDFAVFFAEAEFCLAPIPEETVTVNKPFLEYKNNPTFSSLFSYMSMEYNGKVYTAYHIGFGSSIRDPLLAMLIGEWKAADGEIIKPIGSNIGYEDVYSVPRHFKLVDNAGSNGNIAISGFGDNTLLPNLTFTEDPAVMKFIVTPSSGIAPPPEQPEREWVDLIDVYGAGRGGVGDIHFDIEMKTMGYCKK